MYRLVSWKATFKPSPWTGQEYKEKVVVGATGPGGLGEL